MTDDPKPLAPHTQPITGSDIHVWRAALSGTAEQLAHHEALLSVDEKKRAERFYFERDRNRYIFGRGILRTLLGSYLDIEASEIHFDYGIYGKPSLSSQPEHTSLQFNVAHSNGWAAYVFSWACPVGIDLEHVRPLSDIDRLVKRFYSARESTLIHSLSGDAKWDMFYKIWTCKEAILKAHGSGLTVPLDHFEISFDSNEMVTVHSASEDATQFAVWKLRLVELVSGYRSAVAVNGEIGGIVVQSFEA